MAVYIQQFFLLEGVCEEGVHVLAVSFDLNEMVEFIKDHVFRGDETYFAFRVTSNGGLLQDQSAKPTHDAPASTN